MPQLVPGGRRPGYHRSHTQAVIWHFWLCNCRQNGSRSLWTVHRGSPRYGQAIRSKHVEAEERGPERGGDQGIACPLHPLPGLPCSRATRPPPTPRPGSGQSETAAEEQAEGDASKPRVVCPECMDAGPCSAIPCPCGKGYRSIARCSADSCTHLSLDLNRFETSA